MTFMTGVIFDIKGFALNDGPGIRTTVFMKGCPLHCRWCHNPEGLSAEPELYWKKSRCTQCGKCFQPCDHPDCRPFGRCLHVCPMDNLSVAGKRWTVDELLARLLKERDIYQDGGGVTFSGGEPLLQHAFVRESAERLREAGIHTAIETSSFAEQEVYVRSLEPFSHVLADIKLIDPAQHQTYCGVPNEPILRNLKWLMQSGKNYLIRIPLIPGITDTDENLSGISSFVRSAPVELLPYNEMAGAKYASVGRTFDMPDGLRRQQAEKKKHILSLFENATIR